MPQGRHSTNCRYRPSPRCSETMKISLEYIVDHVKSLKSKPYKTFVSKLLDLVHQIESAMMLRGPYRLVLDSNIVMRLESLRQGKITEGVLATLLAFLFVKRLPFHVDLVIRPVVFYEFLRQRNVQDLREHWQEIRALKEIVEESLEVTLFFDGVETYEGASHYIDIIERDADKISATLRKYADANWQFDFIRPPGGFDGFPLTEFGLILVTPQFAAEGLFEEIDLEYFSNRSARVFFTEHIERRIAEWPGNDRQVIERYPNDSGYLLTKVLHLTPKGNLKGLGDIDVFGTCNLQRQFYAQAHGRYVPASIGLSLDDDLSSALRHFSALNITSRMLGGAADEETLSQQRAALEAFTEDSRRFREGEKRLQMTRSQLCVFFDELDALGVFR